MSFVCCLIFVYLEDSDLIRLPLHPQRSGQKRPMVVGSKAANGCSPERGSFILVSPGQASPFSFSSSVARISVCDRGVAVGQAWR
jgi:hypothetical protein